MFPLVSPPILFCISSKILWISFISCMISYCVKGIFDSCWTCWSASSDFLTITEINKLMIMKVPTKMKFAKYSQYRGPRLDIIGSITFTQPSNVMIWNNVVIEVGKDDQCCGLVFLKRWYPTIAFIKKRIESRIKMLNVLGFERTSVGTINRSYVDFVINLVILSSLMSLATVENCPAIGIRDNIMIAKSKQFQPSLK